jgi:hypothetical protein
MCGHRGSIEGGEKREVRREKRREKREEKRAERRQEKYLVTRREERSERGKSGGIGYKSSESI